MEHSTNHINKLTWLRGIAAFVVIISHINRATEVSYTNSDEPSQALFLSILDLGTFGVMLFFTLSGCTLYISNRNISSNNDILFFYLKRFMRIWPAFVVSLALYIGFGFTFRAYYPQAQGLWIEPQYLTEYSLADVAQYLLLMFNLEGKSGLFNNAYWSLPVEFQFYLLFPLLIFLLRYVGIFGPVFVAGILYYIARVDLIALSSDKVFYLAFTFCGGVIIGYVYYHKKILVNKALGIVLLALCFVSASLVTHSHLIPSYLILVDEFTTLGLISVATVFIVTVTVIELPSPISRFLNWCGNISYSTYLLHNLFISISILLILRLELSGGSERLALVLLITIPATYIASHYSYKAVESPGIKFAKLIEKSVRNRTK